MQTESATIVSPKPTVELGKVFGARASEVKVTMRSSKDVPRFLARLDEVRKRSANSKLKFG